jgi:hypothetical protein
VVGTSFVDYGGSCFRTRDAALETVLALLVTDLEPFAAGDDALSTVLDYWTLQAVAGFMGCVSPDLDHCLADQHVRLAVTAAFSRIAAGLPPEGIVEAGDAGFRRRADRVCGEGQWRMPGALASWVREVTKALEDLVRGRVTQPPDGSWFVDGDGRRLLPRG